MTCGVFRIVAPVGTVTIEAADRIGLLRKKQVPSPQTSK
jgi:hypothetical protein